ncbi:MAG: hypothetical protein SO161_06875 [Treponema sp.]|nr:hypothetical protein [Treponema sp.]
MRFIVNKKIFILLPLFFVMLICFSCKNSIQNEMNEYNSHFSDSDSQISTEAKDPDFRSGRLFSVDEYFVYDDSILILAAPKEASSIKWVFTDPDNKYETVKVKIRIRDGSGRLIRYEDTEFNVLKLELYIPESNLESPKTYKLTLTVTDNKGGVYQDNCGIVIYKRYDR